MANPVSGDSRKRNAARVLRYGAVPTEEAPSPNDDSVDLAQIWGTLVERWRFIFVVAALIFGVTLVLTLNAPMTFKSMGRLYLGDLELFAKSGGAAGNLDISGTAQGDVGSEIEILKSQTLVTRAILESGFNVSITPLGWKPPRFWEWLALGRKPKVIDVPMRELSAVDTALVDNSRGGQTYAVEFITEDEYELRSATGESFGRGKLDEVLRAPELTITLGKGTERGPRAGARYQVLVLPLDATTDQVLAELLITPAKGVGAEAAKVVNLEFTNRSPYFAATFLRRLMGCYLGERQAWKTEDASAAESFVTDQLGSLRDSLEKSEKKLADYRSNTRPVILDNEASAMIAQVGKYEEQRVAARLQVAALSDVKRVLKQPNPPTEAFLVGEANDTVLAGLAASLAQARHLLSDFEQQYGPTAPQTLQAQGQINAQLQMIRSYVTNRLARAEENLGALNQMIAQFEEKLKTVPGAELGLAQLGRESEVYSRVYSYMLERQQQAAIIKASTVSKNRILDFPQIPYHEDSPRLALRMASAPLGILFGAILVLLYRVFATSLQSQTEVRQVLGAHPVYATIPQRGAPLVPEFPDGEGRGTLDVLVGAPNSPFVEAFRTLRTNLYQSAEDERCQVVLITSPRPNDGKTTCIMSLAEILAIDKKRVLVIDGDLRKPTHHELANQPPGQGLRGVLSGQCDWTEAVRNVRFSFGGFDSIGAGKMAPAELLSSERMKRFLQEVRDRYDFILLDSPSYPLVSDALVLATVADTVFTVMRVRNTPRRVAVEHVRRLSSAAMNYGAIVIDTNMVGSEYPYRRRDLAVVRIARRVAASLERPMLRMLGSRVSFLKFWVLLCIGAIVLAAVTLGIRLMRSSSEADEATWPSSVRKTGPAVITVSEANHVPSVDARGSSGTGATVNEVPGWTDPHGETHHVGIPADGPRTAERLKSVELGALDPAAAQAREARSRAGTMPTRGAVEAAPRDLLRRSPNLRAAAAPPPPPLPENPY